jgi:hypothetical protein
VAGDAVLEEGRDIDECGGVADGVVLVLVMSFVDTDSVVAGPLTVVQAFAKGEGSFVKGRADGQAWPPEVASDYRETGMAA